jgi:hypothetical protein
LTIHHEHTEDFLLSVTERWASWFGKWALYENSELVLALSLAIDLPESSHEAQVFANQKQNKMAPKVGLEPTTDRLTADCSTIELLWNPKSAWTLKPA